MGQAIAVTVELTPINCGACGGNYAISERYRKHKEERGGHWRCPYCNIEWGYGKSEIDKVREQLQQELKRHQATLSRVNELTREKATAERSMKRAKAALRKVETRVAAGVCPCCHRTFKQLAAHMQSKHPDYVEEHHGKQSTKQRHGKSGKAAEAA